MTKKESIPLSRKERERLRHRREIMEAAKKMFIRKGYHATTMEEIAQEAEFAVGTIYSFFEGKNDIFNQLFKTAMQEFVDSFMSRVMKVVSPEEAVRELIFLRFELYAEHHSFFKVCYESIHVMQFDATLPVPLSIVDQYNDYITNMSKKICQGIQSGVFIEDDPRFLVLMIDGVIHSFILYWLGKRTEDSPLQYRDRVCSMVLNAIRKHDGPVKENKV